MYASACAEHIASADSAWGMALSGVPPKECALACEQDAARVRQRPMACGAVTCMVMVMVIEYVCTYAHVPHAFYYGNDGNMHNRMHEHMHNAHVP